MYLTPFTQYEHLRAYNADGPAVSALSKTVATQVRLEVAPAFAPDMSGHTTRAIRTGCEVVGKVCSILRARRTIG